MSLDVFQTLGRTLEARWLERNYDEACFPELAAELLEQAEALDKIQTLDVLRWIASESVLPAQRDPGSAFGDLALTLFDTPRFSVSALFWLDGSTAVHQHAFCGAFRVHSGSSVHSRYRFRESRVVNRRFRLGALEVENVSLLETGSVHPIESGERFIHSLFHLERPSVTIVIRTREDPGTRPQWSYWAPGVAMDPFFQDAVAQKKLEAVSMLMALEPAAADVELREMLAGADLQLTFQLLNAIAHQLAADPLKQRFREAQVRERFEQLVGVSRERHGEAADWIVRAVEEERRKLAIIGMRSALTRPEHRFLVALLLNVPRRETVLELLAQRYPDRDPVEEFLTRVHDLATTRELGSSEPNVLGIPDFDQEHLVVLRRLLLGGSAEEAGDDLVAAWPDEPPAEFHELADRIAGSLRDATLFRALFRRP